MNIQRETERLVIRFATEGDYETFVAGYRTCLPSQNRFDDGALDTAFMTFSWYLQLLNRRKEEAEQDYSYMFNIFRKADGCLIGDCNITPHFREEYQYGRIGYTILNPFWGIGYATECVKSLTEIAFEELGLHRLEAHVNLDNPASKRVLLKAGFSMEGIRKGFILEDGIWTDNEIYSITCNGM